MSYFRFIGQIQRCYALFRDSRLEKYGLSGYQSLYLQTICRNPGIHQEALSEKLIFNKSSTSRQISSLEELGLIRRERSEKDKRSILVYPTEKGLALFPILKETMHEFFSLISQDLTEEERNLLDTLSEKVNLRAKEAIRNL